MNNTMDVIVSATGFNYIPKSSYFESKHKSRPSHLSSVVEARRKRTQWKCLHRKSARISTYDYGRNMSPLAIEEPPQKSNDAKSNRRRLLLQQWKDEKEKKKRETASIKKKPFLVGAIRAPPPVESLPVVPKPSSSGRITRSQINKKQHAPIASSKTDPSTAAGRLLVSADFLAKTSKHNLLNNKSFAPANAVFHPPQNLSHTTVVSVTDKGNNGKLKPEKTMVTFEPFVKITQNIQVLEATRSMLAQKGNISELPRKRNHVPQAKAGNQSKLTTQSKSIVKSSQSQSSGVGIPNDTQIVRVTRRNNRLIDKSNSSEIKPVQDSKIKKLDSVKPNDIKTLLTKTGETNMKGKPDKGKPNKITSLRAKTKDIKTKVVEVDTEEPNKIKITEGKNINPKTKEKDLRRPNDLKRLQANADSSVNKRITVSEKETRLAQSMHKKKEAHANGSKPHELMIRSQNTPKKNFPKSESSSEEKLRTPPLENSLTPEQIRTEVAAMSPCVTVSRGKNNARKEAIEKLKDGLLADDVGDSNTVDHFRSQLNSETKRLTAVSDTWYKYAEENILPEHIQELVLAAVGQTRLLISKKLQQFSQLVEQCASGEVRPEGSVTTSDLQGFWDMVFMQVDNVDMRFKQLNDLRERQWVSEEKSKPKRKRNTGNNKTGPATTEASSTIRAMIEAARKAKQTVAPTNMLLVSVESGKKDFDAGFFTVTSPIRDVAARLLTPRPNKSPSLLKDVLSSEARKIGAVGMGSASRAMMRASIIAKSMDHEYVLDAVECSPRLTPPSINLEATPARSILKTPNVALRASNRRKSAKMVLFCDTDEPTQKSQPESPTAGLVKIVVTPDKGTPEKPASNRGSVTKRNRKLAKSPTLDQENVQPEESPQRRITRGMRRSLLEATATPASEARIKRTGARTSTRLTEVH